MLNEALHELRRPLQALALAPPQAGQGAAIESSVQMATAALERLDREINGGAPAPILVPLAVGPLLEAAVSRWARRASRGGGSLRLCWLAGEATVNGDPTEISCLLDNLIVNAIEHGGPTVVLAAERRDGLLRVAVIDSGRAGRPSSRWPASAMRATGLGSKRRHGHGLRIVRRIATAHGGDFRLRCSRGGAEALLDLPLLEGGPI